MKRVGDEIHYTEDEAKALANFEKKLNGSTIIECQVWRVGNSRELIDIGLPEGDRWMPIAVDFSKIEVIKLAGESEFLGDDKPVIYINGDNYTLDIPFKKAVEIWKEIMTK